MYTYIKQTIRAAGRQRASILYFAGILLLHMAITAHQISAQDLILRDMTISTEESFSAQNTITVGPDVTITGTGGVTLNAGDHISFIPGFAVMQGGYLYAKTDAGTGIPEEQEDMPSAFRLLQNYPNPFNPVTSIEFTLPDPEFVELKIFNIIGKKVSTIVSGQLNRGTHVYTFDAGNLASGVYYYQILAGRFQQSRKMVLIR